jgi:hypothetical protein
MPLPSLLTTADYTTIRQTIRADLTSSDLPDPLVAGAFPTAVRQVLELDPLAGTWPSGSDQAAADHDAAVLFAAAFLVGLLPQVTRESFQGYSYSVQPTDPQARADALRGYAVQALLAVLGTDIVTLLRARQFALAPGGRGDVADDSPRDFRVGNLPEGWP